MATYENFRNSNRNFWSNGVGNMHGEALTREQFRYLLKPDTCLVLFVFICLYLFIDT